MSEAYNYLQPITGIQICLDRKVSEDSQCAKYIIQVLWISHRGILTGTSSLATLKLFLENIPWIWLDLIQVAYCFDSFCSVLKISRRIVYVRGCCSVCSHRRYVAVMLDEAHERTIHTDVLFGLLKVRLGVNHCHDGRYRLDVNPTKIHLAPPITTVGGCWWELIGHKNVSQQPVKRQQKNYPTLIMGECDEAWNTTV